LYIFGELKMKIVRDYKVIRKKEVLELIGISNSAFYRLIDDELMTSPINLGCRAVGWYEHEIKEIIRARAQGM
jgi:prophage regulatory protein